MSFKKYINDQYFVWPPLFAKQAAIRRGIDSTSSWQYSGVISEHHTRLIFSIKSLCDMQFCCLRHSFIWLQQFSIGLRSGEFPGQPCSSSKSCAAIHCFTNLALWQGAPSCCNIVVPRIFMNLGTFSLIIWR